MDVSLEQWREQSHHIGSGGQQGAALEASLVPPSSTYFASDPPPLPPHQRVGTPCPAALREDRRGASFVLLPDGAGFSNRRFIELGAGTTVVGRCKSSGIRDHHVSRRHVEVTVPEEGEDGSGEGCCRIKYIGRNCRVVLVGGILLKAEQEVAAGPGTKVILNFNNKGLPRYSYTLVPTENLPVMASTIAAGRRAAAGTASRWHGGATAILSSPRGPPAAPPLSSPPSHSHSPSPSAASLIVMGKQQREQQQHRHHHHHTQQHLAMTHQKQRPGRFRKEAQDKLQKERDEIFSKFADLKFV